MFNGDNNKWSVTDYPDSTVDSFEVLLMWDDGSGYPAWPAEENFYLHEPNMYTIQDAEGHFNVVETYWAPQYPETVLEGEYFWAGFRNHQNECNNWCIPFNDCNYEAITFDDDGASGYWVYSDGSWTYGDPWFHLHPTTVGLCQWM